MQTSYTPILIFDFDSTLISLESLDELAGIALRGSHDHQQRLEKIAGITAAGMAGELPFSQALQERLALFAATRAHIQETVELLHRHVTPSAQAYQQWIRDNASRIYVISGGFKECIVPIVTSQFGIAPDHVFANTFTFADGCVNGCDPVNFLAHDNGKTTQIAALDFKTPVVMIGDGYSDLQVKLSGAADTFIAFTENVSRPNAIAAADYTAANFDELYQILTTPS